MNLYSLIDTYQFMKEIAVSTTNIYNPTTAFRFRKFITQVVHYKFLNALTKPAE